MATEAQGLLRPPSWRDVANEARYQALPATEKAKVFDAWTARAEEYGMATGRLSYEALEIPEQWDGQERPWAQWKANMRGALEAEREIEKREDPGQWAGILNALRRGVAAMEAGRKTVETREAVESAEMIRDNVGRRAEAAEATVGAGARVARAQARSEGRELTQEEEERQQSAVARGEQAAAQTRAQLIGRAEEQDRSAERAAGQAADAAGLVDFYRSAEGVRAFHEAEGGVESAKAFARNPVEIIAATLAESTAPMAQAIVTGAAGGVRGGKAGMAGGAFLGALTAEMTMGTVDALSESGVDYSDPASILAAVQDEEKWQAARERAFRGGVPRAAFDSVGMVLGARLAGMTGESVTRRIVAGTVGEAALGATGETAGQLAESGTVTSGKEIFLEGIAELGMGAGGAVTQLASRLARGQVSGAGGSSAPGQQGAGPSTGPPATTPQGTPIDVEVLPPETLPSSQRPAPGTDPQATPGTRTPGALPAPNRLAYPDLAPAGPSNALPAPNRLAYPDIAPQAAPPAPNRLTYPNLEPQAGPPAALPAPPQRALPEPRAQAPAAPAREQVPTAAEMTAEEVEARARESIMRIEDPQERELALKNLGEGTPRLPNFLRLQRALDDFDARAQSMSSKEWSDNIYFRSPINIMSWGRMEHRPLTRQEASILNSLRDSVMAREYAPITGKKISPSDWPLVQPGDLPTTMQAENLTGEFDGGRQFRTDFAQWGVKRVAMYDGLANQAASSPPPAQSPATPAAPAQQQVPTAAEMTAERMTPEEAGVLDLGPQPQRPRTEKQTFGAQGLQSPSATPERVAAWKESKNAWARYNRKLKRNVERSNAHFDAIKRAADEGKPINAASFEWRFGNDSEARPAGYVRQGDFYVKPPTPETRYVDPSRDPAVLGIVGADPALRMWDVASRWLRSRGGLPQGAFESKVAAEASQRAMRSVATQNVRALESAVEQVLPPRRHGIQAREAERTRILREVNEFMTGARRLGDLPAPVRPVAREMRAHVDRLSNTLVSEGVVQGPLVQIFMANQGTYLNRAYRIFDDPTWRERVPADVRNRALGFFRQQNPRQPHETPQAFETRVRNQVEEMLDVGDQVRGAMAGGGSISRKGLQILKKRKAIAPEIRALWGEYTDAESNYARSISKMSQLVASHRFLTAMRADGLGKYLFPREQAPPGHIYQISAEGNAALSPLDGLVTTKEIKDALELAFKPSNHPWWLVGWFRANGIAKHSKTVLSPITHIRNFTSNMVYTLANGNVPNLLHGGAARVTGADLFPQRVLEALRRGGAKVDDWRAYHRRLVELGVVGDDVRSGELYDTVKDAVGHGLDFVEHAESVWKRTAGRGAKWVARAYQAEDAFWKVVNFEAERRKYGAAYPQWSQQQLDETAARIVRDNLPSYSLVPRAAKILRQFPLAGPFVSFSAEVIRNTGNIARLAVREMGDPATRSIGVRRMAGLIAAQSLPVAAVMMGRAISGTDEEDEAATRALAAPWDRNAMLMMLPPTEEGHGRFLNLSYIDPFAMLKTPVVAWTREDLEGLDESLFQSVLQFTEPFHSEEIFSQAMQEIAANKKRGGGQIYNPQAPLWHRAQEILAHLWGAVEPGFISQGMRVHKAATKQQTHYGRTYDLQTELTALATGQRVVTLDPVDALSWAARKYRGDRSETTAIFTQVLSRAGTVRDEELEAAWETMQRSRAKLMGRMSLSVDGAARLGVRRRDLEAILKAEQAGSEAERAALIQGRVIPWRMTDAQIERAATRPGRIRQVLRVIGPQAFDERGLQRGLQRALRSQAKAPPPRPVLTPAGR